MAGALLTWFLPARWAMPWIASHLHGLQLQHVRGTIWDGRAEQIVANGEPLAGRLHWQLSRRLLLGQLHMDVQFEGPAIVMSGRARQLPDGQLEAHRVSVRADLDKLGEALVAPWGHPRGELQVTIDHMRLQAGWPMQLDASARWPDARIDTQFGAVALGSLRAQARGRNGLIQAQLHDDGSGPLSAVAQLQLSPLGWQLDATLRARQTDPVLRHWLASLGRPAADGAVHLRHRGGLAASRSVPSNP
ncbi:MAG TPA: type II secretion system protein N [Rhodanobacter sp.]